MPNQFVIPDWVAPEALRLLENMREVSQFFDTSYNKQFTQEFPVGETVRVKLPQRYLIRDGLGYTPQPIDRINTTVTCNQIFGIDFEFDDFEAAIKMERSKTEISDQYLKPAMAQLSQEVDSRAALFAYQNANNIVGVLGTDPTTTNVFAAARQRLVELACPKGEKGMIIPPAFNTALVPALQQFFNPASDISKQYREGSIGKLQGADWYESESLWRHTAGTWAGAVTVNGGGQSGTSLAITCTAGDTFNVGDVFGILNVNLVNPMTRRILSVVGKTFTVTAPLVGLGAGNAADVLTISPAIFGPGSQYQNVDALPAGGAALTLFPGTASPNGKAGANGLLLHPMAFALVGVKLEEPKAVELSTQARDKNSGLSVRFVRAWDPIQSKYINRWDTVIGFGNLYPDNCAVRVLGA